MCESKSYTCCFLGHRKISENEWLRSKLYSIIENLIMRENIRVFLFGSNSQFEDLCRRIVSQLKEKYPNVKRVYVRAEYPHIDSKYTEYLLQRYEETYYPEGMISAGKAVYVERNRIMIDKSRFCVMYFDENYLPERRIRKKAM